MVLRRWIPRLTILLQIACVAALVLSAPSSPPTAQAAPLYTSICGPTGTNDNWSDPLYVATCDIQQYRPGRVDRKN